MAVLIRYHRFEKLMSYLSILRPGTAVPCSCYTSPSSLIPPDIPLHSYGRSLHTLLIAISIETSVVSRPLDLLM
jgi:hypothetical protein